MERKQERKTNRKKAVTSLMAGMLALILLLSGTFAWFYTTNEINEFDGNGTIKKLKNSAVLHDDFDKWAEDGIHRKDVFVENTGEDSLFVRIRLDEYMEIDGESLISGAKKADESTWQRHTEEGTVFAEHWNWGLGGAAIQYKPNEEGKQGVVSRYDENGDDTLNGASGLELTHNGKATEVITMADYKGLNETEREAFAGWIMDADGYAYWYEKLPAGETTGRLLNQVSLKDTISEESDYYYGINVVFETVDEDDLDAWLNGTETEDGSIPDKASDDAKKLLIKVSERSQALEEHIGKKLSELELFEEISIPIENLKHTVTGEAIEELTWIVITKEDGKMELISKKRVTGRKFNNKSVYNWETSAIRKYLQEDFYEMLPEMLINEMDHNVRKYTDKAWNDKTQVETSETVYLLSEEEIEAIWPEANTPGRRCDIATVDGTLATYVGHYWLRSPKGNASHVGTVNCSSGDFEQEYIAYVAGIRPVLTINY